MRDLSAVNFIIHDCTLFLSIVLPFQIGESPVMLLGLIQGRHKLEITPLGCSGGSKTLSLRFSA